MRRPGGAVDCEFGPDRQQNRRRQAALPVCDGEMGQTGQGMQHRRTGRRDDHGSHPPGQPGGQAIQRSCSQESQRADLQLRVCGVQMHASSGLIRGQQCSASRDEMPGHQCLPHLYGGP